MLLQKDIQLSKSKVLLVKKKKSSVCFLFYAEKEIGNKELFVVTLILL